MRALTQRTRFSFEPALSFVPGPARAAERLLPDDGAGRLVVDVEVAGGVAQRAHRLAHRRAIAREHGAGQRVRRRAIDDRERLLPLRVGIDVRRDDRSEDLLAQQAVARIRRLDQRRLDEVARPRPWPCRPDSTFAFFFASSRYSLIFVNAFLSMTAPMKLRKSRTSPILMSFIIAIVRSRTSSHSDCGT